MMNLKKLSLNNKAYQVFSNHHPPAVPFGAALSHCTVLDAARVRRACVFALDVFHGNSLLVTHQNDTGITRDPFTT